MDAPVALSAPEVVLAGAALVLYYCRMTKNNRPDDALETETWYCPYGCGASGTAVKGDGDTMAMLHGSICSSNPDNQKK
jgi:hypothetical protein